eukprot:CAMPEP_0181135092 /NCGR_PEP_ID=MMETSP1071-20121207/32439_1 /TAXON_ID=35127 /ORGANISM="Thalassiosira sp., Strain NH16" /LENGTH=232 /DNA_ID=CAMNT_0023221659 /DNA_START=346 /DNA_END=1040 /DNA_ORIENTATION=-
MKSSPTCSRRRRSLLVSSALFLTTDHCYVDANNLRRSSSSSSSHTAAAEGEGIEVSSSNDILHLKNEGFEAVGGATSHEPLISSDHFDWHRSMLREDEVGEREEEDHEPKEDINDETLSFVDPNEPKHNRVETTCGNEQMLWMFEFTTDDYGYEFSWTLERRIGKDLWTDVMSGPPPNQKYFDATPYRGATCLDGMEMYRLTVMDARNDGLCCDHGRGTYSYSVNGITEYDS